MHIPDPDSQASPGHAMLQGGKIRYRSYGGVPCQFRSTKLQRRPRLTHVRREKRLDGDGDAISIQNRPRPGFTPPKPSASRFRSPRPGFAPPDVKASRDHPSDFDSGPDQKRVDNPPERFNAARRVAARGVVLMPSSPCPGARQGPRSLGAVGYPAICA